MTIKAILFVVDRDETAPGGLLWTRALAWRLGAHLQVACVGDTTTPAVSTEDLDHGLVSIHREATTNPGRIERLAQHADLTVIRVPQPGTPAYADEMVLIERIALEVGGPMVVLPWKLVPGRVAKRIAIAWNGSPSARRAVRASLPVLANADAVAVVTIHPDGPLDPGASLVRVLEGHRIAATPEPIIGDDRDAGMLLAQAVQQLEADLLVMGAWSRQPIIERLFGGATRHLLGTLSIPILISA